MTALWAKYAIWWHVYPIGFVGAEREALAADVPIIHRLSHITAWLDYAIELGCSGLALGPIFASESHGYDTTDHFRIDPRLGDEADFDELIRQCQARGLHVLLDGVFNHVGRSFAKFQEALREGEGSDASDWFHITWNDGEAQVRDFEDHGALVELNHDSPAVAGYVDDVMGYWCDRGISGWRLDAAYAVAPQFWRAAVKQVRQTHPDSWFVGEVIHGDYIGYVEASGLDSVTQYELWKATWSSLNDHNLWELAHALGRHAEFCEKFIPMTFVGNHDVTRIASQLSDPNHLGHALVTLFTLPGSPSIYYGDEQGFKGVKEERFGGDDAIRPAFPATAKDLDSGGGDIYRLHQELIALRRRNSWLSEANIEVAFLQNEQLAYFCTPRGDIEQGAARRIVVLLNLSEYEYRFEIDDAGEVGASSAQPAESDPLRVGPAGWAVLTSR